MITSSYWPYNYGVQTDSLQVQIRAILPSPEGCAVYLGNEKKVFVIHVDPHLGQLLALSLSSQRNERPLTHELMGNLMAGFGIRLQRVVINDAVGQTFYARLILKMENELGAKMIEMDGRPSDAMVLAMHAQKPIHVAAALFRRLPDATEQMKKLLTKEN